MQTFDEYLQEATDPDNIGERQPTRKTRDGKVNVIDRLGRKEIIKRALKKGYTKSNLPESLDVMELDELEEYVLSEDE